MSASTSQTPRVVDSLDKISAICRFYLCGYSLRQCAIFSIVFDIVFLFFTLVVVVGLIAYINLHILYTPTPNGTLYYFSANQNPLFEVNTFNVGIINFVAIMTKVLELISCPLVVDVVTNILALVGVFRNQYSYVLPYMFSLINTTLWMSLFLIVDIFSALMLRVNTGYYLLWIVLSIFILQKCYKLTVLLSFLRFYGGLQLRQHLQVLETLGLTTQKPQDFPYELAKTPSPVQSDQSSIKSKDDNDKPIPVPWEPIEDDS